MKVFRRFIKGILLKGESSDPTDNQEGSIWTNSTTNRIKSYIESAVRTMVSEDQTQTLTNKTIDVDNNTVSNIETDNLKAGVLNTNLAGAATDTELPSALAVKTALEAQNEADEITYDNVTSGLTATNVQAAVDEVEGRLDTAETGLSDHLSDAVDAHDASAISNVPAGNLAATDVQAALNELQGDADTNATDISNHLSDAVDAHDASAISNVASGNLVATDVQAALNELQTELDGAASSTDLSNHLSDAVDAHDASAISYVNTTSGMTATDTQAAIDEVEGRVDTLESAGTGTDWSDPVDANIVPDGSNTRDLGSSANRFAIAYTDDVLTRSILIQDSAYTTTEGRLQFSAGTSFPSGASGTVFLLPASATGDAIGIATNNLGGGSITKPILIETGNQSGTADSGDITIRTGTSAAANRGDVILDANKIDMTNATELDVTGITVTGLPAAGANTTLSNLTSPTDVNQDLLSTTNVDLGSSGAAFNNSFIYVANIGTRIDLGNGFGTARATLAGANDTTPSGASVGASFIGTTTALGIFSEGATSTIPIHIETNNNTVGGNSGLINIQTGTTTSVDSASINIETGTSASANRGDITLSSNKLDVSAVAEGVGLPVWKKITVGHAALQAASTANDIELLSLPAAATIHSVIIKHTTAFAGTGVTAYDVSIGIAGDLTKYASAFDILQATGDTVAQTTNVVDVENFGSATSIRIAATSTGANLDQSSAGSIDVYVLMSTLPV